MSAEFDVIIVWGGNTCFCAAASAAQSNAGKVILIDKCPEEWTDGNSYFTAEAFQTVHCGLEDVIPLLSNVDNGTAKPIDLETYTTEDFPNDMSRITHDQYNKEHRYDKELGEDLVGESNEAVKWLARNGLGFQFSFNRQVRACLASPKRQRFSSAFKASFRS
jgi:hypothetical protein